MNTVECQCEHEAHFDPVKRTPDGNPGHRYGARFTGYFMVQVRSERLCPDCAADCRAGTRDGSVAK
jgi:hypothetical protein